MEISREQYNLIQRYLDDEMTPEEEINFELELEKNSLLNDAYIFEIELRDTLDTIELEQTIPGFSINEFHEQSNQLSKVVGMTDIKKQSTKKKIIPFKRWMMYAAAACVGIIALIFVFIPKRRETQSMAIEKKYDSTAQKKNDSSQFLTENTTSDSLLKKSFNVDTTNRSLVSEKSKKRSPLTEGQNSTLVHNENQKVESHLRKIRTSVVDSLKIPVNEKDETNEIAMRGDVYGPKYTDIIIENNTNYVIDIYINGHFRGSLARYSKTTTWAVPGSTKLYAKARFNDGTYYYWGPSVVTTGYKYEWRLYY